MNIIAHKGDTTVATGNTMEALEAAYKIGVFGIEFDVRLTLDHVPIVFHNMELTHTTGVGFVEDYTYEQLQTIPILSDGQTYRIPSLEEVLIRYAGRIYMVIHIVSYSLETITAISNLLAPYKHVWHMMEIICYEAAILRGFHDRCDGLACDYIFRPEQWMSEEIILRLMIEKAKLASARGVHLPSDLITADTLSRMNSHGLEVHCNIVNDKLDAQRIHILGVTQIMTDNIHLFL